MATATVLRQEPDQYDFTNPGSPVLGTIVYFQTGAGNNGSVFVPATRYNVKNIHAAIKAAAEVIDEVGSLEINY